MMRGVAEQAPLYGSTLDAATTRFHYPSSFRRKNASPDADPESNSLHDTQCRSLHPQCITRVQSIASPRRIVQRHAEHPGIAFEVLVGGEDRNLAPQRKGAQQEVGIGTLHAASTAT